MLFSRFLGRDNRLVALKPKLLESEIANVIGIAASRIGRPIAPFRAAHLKQLGMNQAGRDNWVAVLVGQISL